MTVPPDQGREPEPPLDFDPYRFGPPEHPIAPEYAPPGYRPPVGQTAPQFPYTPSPPPPPPGGYAMYGPPRSNTKATVALVLGILAIVFCWTTILDLVLIVPAIVLGTIGRGDAARDPARGGRSAATGGLVCGIVAAVLAVAAGAYIYNRVKPCIDQYGGSPTSSAYQQCVSDRLLGAGK